MSKSSRIKEYDLEDMNLVEPDDPKLVHISAKLEESFKAKLRALLLEFKVIFAWHYYDMRGVDPSLCLHRINLKKDAEI